MVADRKPANKPHVIILAGDDPECATWLSDGWYRLDQRGQPEAERLFTLVKKCFAEAQNVQQAKELLEANGFRVTLES